MIFQESRNERSVDAALHGAGVILGAIGAIVLAATAMSHAGSHAAVSLGLYTLGLLSMLTCSALYNLTRNGPNGELLRRIDHAAVYLMIAGTYSPVALLVIGGGRGAALFAFVWAVAAAGAVLKIAFPRRFERLSIAAYLALGWTVIVVAGPLSQALSVWDLALLAAGCLLYSTGVLFHLWTKLPYHNAVWHALVLAAAACHYAVILGIAAAQTNP